MKSLAQRQALLARGQDAAEAGMTDVMHLERPTGRTVQVDGRTVPEMETVWPPPEDPGRGRGKTQSQQSYPSQPEAGGGTTTLAVFEVHISARDPFVVLVDDEFVVDTSQDLALVGTRFRVRVDPSKTWRTARRFNVEEVVA